MFGFGPDKSIDTHAVRDYLLLPYMVLDAVMAGWAFLMIQIVRGPLKEGSAWAWTFLVRSLTLWFVHDTGMSLVLGHPTHAVFNIPFAIALGIPLVRLKPITLQEDTIHVGDHFIGIAFSSPVTIRFSTTCRRCLIPLLSRNGPF